MTPDIEARIDADFVMAQRMDALGILRQLESDLGKETSRILRCVVFLARGDLERLAHFANQARADYRDVIYWAEYDERDRHLRDFNSPFAASGW